MMKRMVLGIALVMPFMANANRITIIDSTGASREIEVVSCIGIDVGGDTLYELVPVGADAEHCWINREHWIQFYKRPESWSHRDTWINEAIDFTGHKIRAVNIYELTGTDGAYRWDKAIDTSLLIDLPADEPDTHKLARQALLPLAESRSLEATLTAAGAEEALHTGRAPIAGAAHGGHVGHAGHPAHHGHHFGHEEWYGDWVTTWFARPDPWGQLGGDWTPMPPPSLDGRLNVAAMDGNLDELRRLIDGGADVHNNNDCPLEYAAEHGHLNVVRLLVERYYTERTEANTGALSRALHRAVFPTSSTRSTREHADVVRFLIEHGADVNANHLTLAIAAESGDLAMVRLLVAGGADLSRYGARALEDARRHRHMPVVEFLTNVLTPALLAGSRLIQAAREGYLAIVQELVTAGANVNAQNNVGTTALMRAAANGHLPIVEYLIAHHADVNIHCSDFATTALMDAVVQNHLPIVKYLVEHGADVNAQDRNGYTALSWAVMKRSLPIVQYLLERGANATIRDRGGGMALDITHDPAIQDALRRSMASHAEE